MQQRSSPLNYAVAVAFLVVGGWKIGHVAHDAIDPPQTSAGRPKVTKARRAEPPALAEPFLTLQRGDALLPRAAADAGNLRGASEAAFAATGEDRGAQELTESMQRLVRDLEYSPGLKEPPQQVVVDPPDPWRPDPRAEAAAPPVIDDVVPRRAPHGSIVTIRGKNLRVAQVVFGQAPARIVGGTGEEVTVEVPSGAGEHVAVAVTNADGKYALADDGFSYAN